MARNPARRRSGCPISHGLDIFGDKWTLLILRDLLLKGKSRFREFLGSEESIASNILSERLSRLERSGLATKGPDPNDRRRTVYRPTQAGAELLPVLVELAYWGAIHDPATLAPRAFALAYRKNRAALIAKLRSAIQIDRAGGRRSSSQDS